MSERTWPQCSDLPEPVLDIILAKALIPKSVESTMNLLLVCKLFRDSISRMCDVKATCAVQTTREVLRLGVCTAARLRRLSAIDVPTLSFEDMTALTKLQLQTRMVPRWLSPTLRHLELSLIHI